MIKHLRLIGVISILTFCIQSNAQVTIGSNDKPNTGTLLDLKDGKGTGDANSEKGLLLPRVKMTTTTPIVGKMAQSIGATGTWAEDEHTGLVVYNVIESLNACRGGADVGLFVWNGSKWVSLSTSKAKTPPAAVTPPADLDGANSYIVKPGGTTVSIKVSRGFQIWDKYKGNTPADGKVLDISALNLSGTMAANVVWQEASSGATSGVLDATTPVTISGTGTAAQLIVKSGLEPGNALVNVTLGTTVLWQWHIWVTATDPTTTAYKYNNGKSVYWFMDRNLGSNGTMSNGMYYQWGRPTPFNSQTLTSTAANAKTSERENLTTAIQTSKFIAYVSTDSHDWYSVNKSQWDERWGNQNTTLATKKSPFDPCPEGWRVPSGKFNISPWNCLTKPAGSFGNGWNFDEPGKTIGDYPASGYRSNGDGSLGDVGKTGYVWDATPNGALGSLLYFNKDKVDPTFVYNRANALAVRCARDI